MTPINQLIDGAVKCTKCGAGMSIECACFIDERLERELVEETVRAIEVTTNFTELLSALESIVIKYKK